MTHAYKATDAQRTETKKDSTFFFCSLCQRKFYFCLPCLLFCRPTVTPCTCFVISFLQYFSIVLLYPAYLNLALKHWKLQFYTSSFHCFPHITCIYLVNPKPEFFFHYIFLFYVFLFHVCMEIKFKVKTDLGLQLMIIFNVDSSVDDCLH